MRLHVQHVADVAGADTPQHLNNRRRMAAIETNAHGDLRPAARIYRLLGTGAGHGQRFFDMDMFAGFGSGNNLFMVFCMRGGQHRASICGSLSTSSYAAITGMPYFLEYSAWCAGLREMALTIRILLLFYTDSVRRLRQRPSP